MDGHAEQLVQLLADAAEREQPGILRQVDEQVQVGVGALLAPGDTPEHPHVAHAAPAGPHRAAGRG